jgi:TP901 family phage tail tape measure protein
MAELNKDQASLDLNTESYERALERVNAANEKHLAKIRAATREYNEYKRALAQVDDVVARGILRQQLMTPALEQSIRIWNREKAAIDANAESRRRHLVIMQQQLREAGKGHGSGWSNQWESGGVRDMGDVASSQRRFSGRRPGPGREAELEAEKARILALDAKRVREEMLRGFEQTLDAEVRAHRQSVKDQKALMSELNRARSEGQKRDLQQTKLYFSTLRQVQKQNEKDEKDFQKFLAAEKKEQAARAAWVARKDQEAQKKTQEAVRRTMLTWRDLTRIFLIQSIHTVIGRFIAELRSAVDTAAQFQVKIAEIRTISQDNQQGFKEWGSQIRALSDEFGNPILDVAAGVYETISNQVAKGAQAVQFMSKALEFGRVTQASAADSVNLLSSALNSFKLNADQTEKVASIFFRVIDLGRVRASELANTFGRVGPLAQALGVSLEETGAAIATLTINGVPANETYTLINNVLTHLLKPTKEMRILLERLGFATGEAFIQANGFAGALRIIERETEGSTEALGALFQDMRAIRGIVGLTGSALDGFEKNLRKISDPEPYKRAQEQFKNLAGKDFQVELNKIKNFFVQDFGQSIVNTFGELGKSTDVFGGRLGTLSEITKRLVNVGSGALKVYIGYKALTIANTALTAIQTRITHAHALALYAQAQGYSRVAAAGIFASKVTGGIGGLFSGTNVALAGIAAFVYFQQRAAGIRDEIINIFDNLETKATETAGKVTKDYFENLNRQNEGLKKALDIRIGLDLKHHAAARRVLSETVEANRQAVEAGSKHLENIFSIQIKNMEDAVSVMETGIQNALNAIDKSKERVFEIREGLDNRLFRKQIGGLSGDKQIEALMARAKQQNERASQLFATGDSKNVELAIKAQAAADALHAEVLDKKNDAARELEETTKRRIELEERLKASEAKGLLRDEQDALRAGIKSGGRNGKIRDQIRGLGREIGDISSEEQARRDALEIKTLVDKEKALKLVVSAEGSHADVNNLINEQLKKRIEMEERFQKAQMDFWQRETERLETEKQRVATLKDLFAQLSKIEVSDKLKTDEDKSRLMNEFSGITDKLVSDGLLADPSVMWDIEQQRIRLSKQADAIIAKNTHDSRIEALQAEREAVKTTMDETLAKTKEVTNEQEKRYSKVREIIEALALEYKKSFGTVFGTDTAFEDARALALKFQGAPNQANRSLLDAKIADLVTRVLKAKDLPKLQLDPGQPSANASDIKISTGQTLQEVENELGKLTAQIALNQKVVVDSQKLFQDQAKNLDSILTEEAKLAAQSGNTSDQFKSLSERLATSIDRIRQLNTAIDEAAGRFRNLNPVPGRARGGYAPTSFSGTPLWLPRGTDTVPAMLTPGEFIVRADMARQHHDLLQAINSGKPIYRADGGYIPYTHGGMNRVSAPNQTTQISGTYNVHVHESSSPQATAREVVKSLQREQRRSNFKL